MGLKKASLSCLLIIVLMQWMVNCENVTEPTSNPGVELSVQSLLETKTTTAKVKEEETPTTTEPEGSTTKTTVEKEISTVKETTSGEQTTVATTTITEEETTAITRAERGTKTDEPSTTVTGKAKAQDSTKTTTTAQAKTLTTVSTATALKVETTLKAVTEKIQSARAATKTTTLTTSSAPADEIKASPTVSYKASSDIGYTVKMELAPNEESMPVMTSYPFVASFKEMITSSKSTEIVATSSEAVNQLLSQISTKIPHSMAHPPVRTSPVLTSKSQNQMTTPQIDFAPSSSTPSKLVTSHPIVTPSQQILTSSKSEEQVMKSHSEVVASSSTAEAIETSHSALTSSQTMKLMTPSTEMVVVATTSKKVMTSSTSSEEVHSSKALRNSPSTIFEDLDTLSRALPTETPEEILPASSSEQLASSHYQGRLTSPYTVEITSLPETALTTRYQAKESITLSSSEAVTSTKIELPSLTTNVTSQTSIESFKSTSVANRSFKHIEVMWTLYPTKILTSSSITPSSHTVTSFRTMKFMTSYQTMKSTPVFTGFPSLKNTMSSQEMKATKSTLILSSFQLADLTTSSPTAVTSVVEPPTTATAEMETTTTEKAQETSSTQFPETVMTSTYNSTPIVIATSNASEATTEHPTHSGDKHHTLPGETHAHTNHTRHAENMTHHTMGYPHEPEVDASTDEKQQRVDANWEVSVIVVLALLGGMIVFVVFMVVKDRARTGGANLSIKKRPVIGDDHGFIPLKEVKTEESKEPKEPKLTKAEKRQSLRNSYYGNPEDAVPLLELHITESGPAVLNAHDESQGPKYGGPIKDSPPKKPLLEVYGDDTQKSREKVNEEA